MTKFSTIIELLPFNCMKFSIIKGITLNKSKKHRLLTLNNLISHVQIIVFRIHKGVICPHSLFRIIIDNA